MNSTQAPDPVGACGKGAVFGAFAGAVMAYASLKTTAWPELAAGLTGLAVAAAVALLSSRANLYQTGKGLPFLAPTAIGASIGVVTAIGAYWLGWATKPWVFLLIPGTVSGGVTGLAQALFQRGDRS
jgi:hypothetical protein